MTQPEMFTRLQDPIRDRFAAQVGERAVRFRAAIAEHDLGAALGRFATDTEATVFAKDESNPLDERAEVARALVLCYQKDPHEMWSYCVLAMFSKVMEGLRFQLRGVEDSEAAQMLAEHLLEAARGMNLNRPGLLIFFRMKQRLKETLCEDLRRERRHRRSRGGRIYGDGTADLQPDEDEDDEGAPITATHVDSRPEERERERYRRVIEAVKDQLTEEELATLTCAVDAGGFITDAAANKRDWEAKKRRKSRLHTRVRKILVDNGLWEALGPGLAMPALGIC